METRNLKNKPIFAPFFFAPMVMLALFINACGPPVLYDHNEPLSEPWTSSQPANFTFDVVDTIKPYDLFINLRHKTQYNYSNLYLFIHSTLPNGIKYTDTVEIFLADVNGNWLGSGLSSTKDLQVMYRKKGRFPMKGKYNVKMEQAMRNTQLESIQSIGLRIQESKQEK